MVSERGRASPLGFQLPIDQTGDATTLAPAVKQAFAEVYRQKNGGGDAKAWLASMKEAKRYLSDIWPKN